MNGAFRVVAGKSGTIGVSATQGISYLAVALNLIYYQNGYHDACHLNSYEGYGHDPYPSARPQCHIIPASLTIYCYILIEYTPNVAIGATSDYPALSRRYAHLACAGRMVHGVGRSTRPSPSPLSSNTLNSGRILPRLVFTLWAVYRYQLPKLPFIHAKELTQFSRVFGGNGFDTLWASPLRYGLPGNAHKSSHVFGVDGAIFSVALLRHKHVYAASPNSVHCTPKLKSEYYSIINENAPICKQFRIWCKKYLTNLGKCFKLIITNTNTQQHRSTT